MCISISLSASVALICLYSPKMYILVFHPDKNVRKLTMNSTVYRRSATTGQGGAATSSAISRTQVATGAATLASSDHALQQNGSRNSPSPDLDQNQISVSQSRTNEDYRVPQVPPVIICECRTGPSDVQHACVPIAE